MFTLNYGFPILRKSEARDVRTDRQTDGRGATICGPQEGRVISNYKKAQLSLTNPRDAKACQNGRQPLFRQSVDGGSDWAGSWFFGRQWQGESKRFRCVGIRLL